MVLGILKLVSKFSIDTRTLLAAELGESKVIENASSNGDLISSGQLSGILKSVKQAEKI
ncbi:hypothetical protein MKR64_15735 [Acinetobacter baumannii]